MNMIDPFAARVGCSCRAREVGDVTIAGYNVGNNCTNKIKQNCPPAVQISSIDYRFYIQSKDVKRLCLFIKKNITQQREPLHNHQYSSQSLIIASLKKI